MRTGPFGGLPMGLIFTLLLCPPSALPVLQIQWDDSDVDMVGCDGCDFWVHSRCDRVAARVVAESGEQADYFCPPCRDRQERREKRAALASSSSGGRQMDVVSPRSPAAVPERRPVGRPPKRPVGPCALSPSHPLSPSPFPLPPRLFSFFLSFSLSVCLSVSLSLSLSLSLFISIYLSPPPLSLAPPPPLYLSLSLSLSLYLSSSTAVVLHLLSPPLSRPPRLPPSRR